MTRKQMILVIGIEITIFFLFSFTNISIPCFFKSVLSIPCPGCGMTRAYHAFIEGHFIEAFSYNILFYPVLCFLSFIPIRFLIALKKGESRVSFSIIKRPYIRWILVFLLVCSEIYNLVIGI